MSGFKTLAIYGTVFSVAACFGQGELTKRDIDLNIARMTVNELIEKYKSANEIDFALLKFGFKPDLLEAQLINLDEKIVPVRMNTVHSIKQLNEKWSAVTCGYAPPEQMPALIKVLVPSDGVNFFTALQLAGSGSSPRTVYIRVRHKTLLRIERENFNYEAIGTRYSSSEKEYSW